MTKSKIPKNICVFCSSSNAVAPVYFDAAAEIGALIAKKNYRLIYGGGNLGLMGALARSVQKDGGKVIGIIPKKLRIKGIAYEDADELLVTKDLRERKARMESRSDAFLALPGGFGTLEEILELLTLKQLKYHDKPIVFLNTNGFFDLLTRLFEQFYRERFAKLSHRDCYFMAPNPNEAMEYIENYKPPSVEDKWPG